VGQKFSAPAAVISVPLTGVPQTRERLLRVQLGIELALRVLDKAGAYGSDTALSGVSDVLAAVGVTVDAPATSRRVN
jgi:hypothetical protein